MNETHLSMIARELGEPVSAVRRTAELLADQATVPFIARYRKEATGGMDEVRIRRLEERLRRLAELEKRRTSILRTIEEQGALTEELKRRIEATYDARELEDLYLPYRPRRRTRAQRAREAGLEPLAELLLRQGREDPQRAAGRFLSEAAGDEAAALQGARDILAERMHEDAELRRELRRLYSREAEITARLVKGQEEAGEAYRDYHHWREPMKRIAAHRWMALRRGGREGVLQISLGPGRERALELIGRRYLRGAGECSRQVEQAGTEAWSRLIAPSLEKEFLDRLSEEAEKESIDVFTTNLRQLLLAPPLGRARIMALDPGYRTGCKVVCLDEQGELLEHTAVYPHPPRRQVEQTSETLRELARRHRIDAVAVGDGTAGRETERLLRSIDFSHNIAIFSVSEDGASVYSASDIARWEFPDHDVTVRGAVSIGRRLLDPLAELVKIDPKAIGVGQYQHDVDQKRLRKALEAEVESCVNLVGVDVNTAGVPLLRYVAGLGSKTAEALVARRSEQGPYHSRRELLKVPGLGPKGFEQSAGFLRIPGGDNPLDDSAVHPEAYPLVERIAADLNCGVRDLIRDEGLRKSVVAERYADEHFGLPTIRDILSELAKPGRDPRPRRQEFSFAEGVESIDDLQPGMELPGLVTNLTRFGAFVDIGVKQDGLVHISEMAERYVRDPAEVVHLRQAVRVRVVEVDRSRGRISLSLKPAERDAPGTEGSE
jgi:uncharacterized protein